jgi:hypothetical protein
MGQSIQKAGISLPRKLGSNNNSAGTEKMVTSHVCQGSKSKDLPKVQKTVLQNIEKQPEKQWKVHRNIQNWNPHFPRSRPMFKRPPEEIKLNAVVNDYLQGYT